MLEYSIFPLLGIIFRCSKERRISPKRTIRDSVDSICQYLKTRWMIPGWGPWKTCNLSQLRRNQVTSLVANRYAIFLCSLDVFFFSLGIYINSTFCQEKTGGKSSTLFALMQTGKQNVNDCPRIMLTDISMQNLSSSSTGHHYPNSKTINLVVGS